MSADPRPVALSLVLFAAACAKGGSATDEGHQGPLPDAAPIAGRVDAGPRIDAGPLPADAAPGTIDAAGIDAGSIACAVPSINLLANPGFDAGATSWAQTSTGGYALIVADTDPGLSGSIASHSAPNLAWLGGDVALDDHLSQDVVVPSGTAQLIARGRIWLTSEEFGFLPYDTVDLSLRSSSGSLIQTLGSYSNLDITGGWTAFEFAVTTPHAGETVRFDIAASNDFSDPSNFFFDSLELVATASCP